MKRKAAIENFRDVKWILFRKKRYKEIIANRYQDSLTGFDDLLSAGCADTTALYYLLNRHWLYLLSNNPEIAVDEGDLRRRKKLYSLVKKLGKGMIACTQVMEDCAWIDCPNGERPQNVPVPDLPDHPVIFVSNHGFRDDVLASVLAAGRHAYKICGSLPMFYNSFNGFASSLIGDIVVNRKVKESRRASLEKAKRVLDLGTDLIIYPEGGWNKTMERPMLELWGGVYEISKAAKCEVIPIIHYNREPEILDKKNLIHTVICEPIPLYEMEKTEALRYLRDEMASWQWKMMEIFGQSTREQEIGDYSDCNEKWKAHLTERMKAVEFYDEEIEKNAEFRPREIVRAEDVFRPIANIQNVTPLNVKDVIYAKELVKTIEESDWQKLF